MAAPKDAEAFDELAEALRVFFEDQIRPDIARNTTDAVRRILNEHAQTQSALNAEVLAASEKGAADLRADLDALLQAATILESSGQRTDAAIATLQSGLESLTKAIADVRAIARERAHQPTPSPPAVGTPAPVATGPQETAIEALLMEEPTDAEVKTDPKRPSTVWSVMRENWDSIGVVLTVAALIAITGLQPRRAIPETPHQAVVKVDQTPAPNDAVQRGWALVLEDPDVASACEECQDFAQAWARPAAERPSHEAILQAILVRLADKQPLCKSEPRATSGLWDDTTRKATAAAARCLNQAALGPPSEGAMAPERLRALAVAALTALGAPSAVGTDGSPSSAASGTGADGTTAREGDRGPASSGTADKGPLRPASGETAANRGGRDG